MLYFDLLGIMQFCGIHINALTYVTIVISIGLLVDFLVSKDNLLFDLLLHT